LNRVFIFWMRQEDPKLGEAPHRVLHVCAKARQKVPD